MAELNFVVKTDLVVGGRIHSPTDVRKQLSDDPANMAAPPLPGTVTQFYLAAWMGGSSKAFSVKPIAADGTSSVRLPLTHGDVDTVKLAVTFNMTGPLCQRNCHLASSFIHMEDLISLLKSTPASAQFGASQSCFSMRDNFTRNAAVLRFKDIGTNFASVSRLRLKASALRSLDRTSEAVFKLGKSIQSQVSQFAITPLNAGPSYVEAFTYGQLSGFLSHYALLGHSFSCMSAPVDLQWVMYNAYQTVQSTGIRVDALAGIPDAELVPRFGLPLISRHTSCALSSVYCSDYTVSAVGTTCKLGDAEDIGKTFSKLSLETQGVFRQYDGLPAGSAQMPLKTCIAKVKEGQTLRVTRGLGERISCPILADDCENSAQGIIFSGFALRDTYRNLLGGRTRDEVVKALAAQMCQAARGNPLFVNVTSVHHAEMAKALVRLGRMIHEGTWTNTLAVVSAKGPSYTELTACDPGNLSGHGTVIARVKDEDTGLFSHFPVEGTTYLSVDLDPPKGYAKEVSVKLADGTSQTLDLSTCATVLAQNLHVLVGVSCDAALLAHMRADYGQDPTKMPFYVSAFYTGLSEGQSGSIGCLPLDTKPPRSYGDTGCMPLFGAPVLGLSRASTVASPVTEDLLGETPEEQRTTLKLIEDQVREAWSPEADPSTIRNIMSFYQPCASPDDVSLSAADHAKFIRSENTWAFDDPQHTAAAVQIYRALASKFNELQAKDAKSDGAAAQAYGQYLSAALRIVMPVPREKRPFELSTMRNMRQAALELGISELVKFPLKMNQVGARAKVESDQHFYMCAMGGGPVHAHRLVLA